MNAPVVIVDDRSSSDIGYMGPSKTLSAPSLGNDRAVRHCLSERAYVRCVATQCDAARRSTASALEFSDRVDEKTLSAIAQVRQIVRIVGEVISSADL